MRSISEFELRVAEAHILLLDGFGYDRGIGRGPSMLSHCLSAWSVRGLSRLCIVEDREATVVVTPGCQVTIDGYRNIVIAVGKDETA